MAIVPGPALSITAPGPGTIPYPSFAPQQQWTSALVMNESPYHLEMAVGGTPMYSIPPWTANVIPLVLGPASVNNPGQPLTYVAVGPALGSITSGTINVDFGQYSDRFPGVYPLELVPPAASTSGYVRTLLDLPSTSVQVFTFALQPADRGIFLIMNTVGGGLVSCIGNNSGVDWLKLASFGHAPFGLANTITALIPVMGGIDTQVTLTASYGGTAGFFAEVFPDEIMQGSRAAPTITQDLDAHQLDSNNQVTAAAGNTTNLVPTPTAGTFYRVKYLSIVAPTTVAGTARAFITLDSSGFSLLGAYTSTAGINQYQASNLAVSDSISLHNATAVTATGLIIYQVESFF